MSLILRMIQMQSTTVKKMTSNISAKLYKEEKKIYRWMYAYDNCSDFMSFVVYYVHGHPQGGGAKVVVRLTPKKSIFLAFLHVFPDGPLSLCGFFYNFFLYLRSHFCLYGGPYERIGAHTHVYYSTIATSSICCVISGNV